MTERLDRAETGVDDVVRLVEEFCDSLLCERNLSAQTQRAYRGDLLDFARWARRSHVDPLTTGHRGLRGYLADLDAARYSRRTVNRRLSAIKTWYAWLLAKGVRDDDPASLLSGPRQPRSLPRRISAVDMAAILAVHSDSPDATPVELRDRALLEFWYACGSRISESADLRVHDVDFDQGIVRLFGKGMKERIVPLHPFCLASMRAYLDRARPSLLRDARCECFFVSSRGCRMSPDAMRRMFKATLAAAGVSTSFTPHDMRHTFASDLLEGGADLRSVQEMLGHASLSTTQVYTHVATARLAEVHRLAHPRAE